MPRRRFSRGYARTRRRYGSKGGGLTGGTGDVNPQWFNLNDVTEGTANYITATGRSVVSTVPVQQSVMMKAGKTLVMEILGVQFSKTAGTSAKNIGMVLIYERFSSWRW